MNKRQAFTLVEILAGISILIIIGFAIIKINFNYLTANQKIEIFSNSIASEIERVRNNALIGKSAGSSFTTPEQRKVDFSISGDGSMISSYYDGSSRIVDNTLNIEKGYSIDNIFCVTNLTSSETGTILFVGGDISLDNNCYTTIEMTISTSYNISSTKDIVFSSTSGLIKR